MGRYLIRRTLFMLLVLWVISVLTFLIFVKLPPGDPARRLAGRSGTPEVIELIQERLGLNDALTDPVRPVRQGIGPLAGLVAERRGLLLLRQQRSRQVGADRAGARSA